MTAPAADPPVYELAPPHHRPRGLLGLLTVAVLIGLVSLVLAIQNAVALDDEAERRETERIASDFSACERGNVLRQQVIDLGAAEDELVTGIVDTVLPTDTGSPRVAELRLRLDPLLEDFRKEVADVTLVNCDRAVPGGRDAQKKLRR